MKALFSMGEILIDFIPDTPGKKLAEVEKFHKMPGGAPANVAAAAKLGSKAYFLGKIARDGFGDFLLSEVTAAGVDTSLVVRSDEGKASLAFVSLLASGERDFIFFREHCADELYCSDEVPHKMFSPKSILHFCSVSLHAAPIKAAHEYAIAEMKKHGGTTSFDLNVRENLWQDHDAYRQTIKAFIAHADILKASDEDLRFLLNTDDLDAQRGYLLSLQGPSLILFTRGAKPTEVFYRGQRRAYQPPSANCVDTTGAGDTFIGAFLHCLLQEGKQVTELNEADLAKFTSFAQAAAAVVVSAYGAIPAMPNLSDVLTVLQKKNPRRISPVSKA